MGIVKIPANPSAAGHLSVQLHLDVADVQSINSLLHQAANLTLLGPKIETTSRAVQQAVSNSGRVDQFDRRLDQQVNSPSHPPIEEDINATSPPGPQHAPNTVREQLHPAQHVQPPSPHLAPEVVREQLPPAQHVQSRDQVPDASAPVTDKEPESPQNAWSKKLKEREDIPNAQGSSQAKTNTSSGELPKGWGQETRSGGFEQYDGQGSQAIPATNSPQEWPTAQQAQTQPQSGNKVTYGGANAGNVQYGRTGGRNAGKKGMASKGFVAPIQITRMGWGDPLPNAQDTWGEEELAPQPLASAMPAAGKPSKRRPAPPPPAFPPMPEVQDDVPPQHSSGPASHVQPQVTMHWQRMWTTDALDHIGDEVRACLHVTKIPDLVDDSGGAGWLITTSNGLLNLWACTCIGSPGEPALQLVHALETEFLTSDLQIDPAHNLLMAVGRDTKAFTECVALHHLRLQPGVFRLKGRLNLPTGVTGRLAKNTGSIKALQVQSVDAYKGTMTGCCVASHDRSIAVYSANVVPGEVAKPKAVWPAHGRTITVLHANRFCASLLSGDDGGAIRIWNMIRKPTAPDIEVRHERSITGLHSIGEHSFVSCSMDGRLCVWDMTIGRRPVSTMQAPDNRPILKMAVHVDGLVAFCTQTGLYVANVFHNSPIYTVAVSQEHEDPIGCLAWNTGSTGQMYLYASTSASISAFRASQYER